MINYISSNISKKSLKNIGRKIVLELFEKNKILSKYQIFNKYLFLTSMEYISDDFKAKYKLIEANLCNTNVENIYQNVKNIIPAELDIETFAIKVERKGEHRFTSTELARQLAGSVFELFPNLKVDLENPNLKVHIKVLNNICLIYVEKT
tara:strand:+ start:260 stop:709 length:450 start_codon:yes stop_codon:yes gene_type:complete